MLWPVLRIISIVDHVYGMISQFDLTKINVKSISWLKAGIKQILVVVKSTSRQNAQL